MVEEVFDTGAEEVVYKCRVADYHTYFVGRESWGFTVWAHNVCRQLRAAMLRLGLTNNQAEYAWSRFRTGGEASLRQYLAGRGVTGEAADLVVGAGHVGPASEQSSQHRDARGSGSFTRRCLDRRGTDGPKRWPGAGSDEQLPANQGPRASNCSGQRRELPGRVLHW